MVLNIKEGKRWLGIKPGRSNISDKTWRLLVDQGLLAGSKFISTEAVEAWLEAQAGIPMGGVTPPSSRTAPCPAKRSRGRPKK